MSKRDSNIVKCIAIILVYVHHLFYEVPDIDNFRIVYGPLFPSYESLSVFGYVAKICVSMFVFLSGYGIFRTYQLKGLDHGSNLDRAKDSLKRYIKLLTSFQVVYIIAALVSGLFGVNLKDVYGGGQAYSTQRQTSWV